jgi:hypothetical protein
MPRRRLRRARLLSICGPGSLRLDRRCRVRPHQDGASGPGEPTQQTLPVMISQCRCGWNTPSPAGQPTSAPVRTAARSHGSEPGHAPEARRTESWRCSIRLVFPTPGPPAMATKRPAPDGSGPSPTEPFRSRQASSRTLARPRVPHPHVLYTAGMNQGACRWIRTRAQTDQGRGRQGRRT